MASVENKERKCRGYPPDFNCHRKPKSKAHTRCKPCGAVYAKMDRTSDDIPLRCSGCLSNPDCKQMQQDDRGKCASCVIEITNEKRGEGPRCPGCHKYSTCWHKPGRGSTRCWGCIKADQEERKPRGEHIAPRKPVVPEAGKDEKLCNAPGCTNTRAEWDTSTTRDGEAMVRYYLYCNPCLRIWSAEIQKNARYRNPTDASRERINGTHREAYARRQQRWVETEETMAQLKHVPRSTSKFAQKVYAEIFNTLSIYNIRFKPEFNYLAHKLYQRTSSTRECGLRADLLIEIELEDREKPLIIVIEVQGAQHRPLLEQHVDSLKKSIHQRYSDLNDAEQSLLLDILRCVNEKHIQEDLAKILMSVKQGFTHIILFSKSSAKMAIMDALQGKENLRVYYPSENGVDKHALIDQFVNQLLLREGSWRSNATPCAKFELCKAFSIMSKDKATKTFDDDDSDDGEDEVTEDEDTIDEQEDDRASILMRLEKIHPRFLDFTPVENLIISFTAEYAGSIDAQSEEKPSKKRARSDETSSESNSTSPQKKKKTNN